MTGPPTVDDELGALQNVVEALTKTVEGLLPERSRVKQTPVAPAPVPAVTVAVVPEVAAAPDTTEAEIVDRLNEILGDPTGRSGSAG